VFIEKPTASTYKNGLAYDLPDEMRTTEDAREAASIVLAASAGAASHLVILESATEEFAAGWIFYYQNAEYLKTGDVRHALLGNAPLFVPRDGSGLQFVSYQRPISESMDAYRYCGNANAQPNAEVELLTRDDDAQAIQAVRAIRDCSALGMGAAKAAIDACLAGRRARVSVESVAAALALKEKLGKFGFTGTITYGSGAAREY